MIEASNLTEWTGSEVKSDVAELLTPKGGKALRELLVRRGVLVFRELGLSEEQQLQLANLIGTVREEGGGGIFKISLDKSVNPGADYLKGSFLWHMDGTHDDVPVFGTLLTSRKLSEVGGQTEFVSSYAAYEALPQAMKDRIEGLRVVHSFVRSMERAQVEPTEANITYWNSIPIKTHSLVWKHRCGRKSLVIGCHASHIEGMDREESEALLDELMAWTTQPRFKYRHEWKLGDLLIWDNTGVLHRAEPYPADSGRVMNRTTLIGEEAFA